MRPATTGPHPVLIAMPSTPGGQPANDTRTSLFAIAEAWASAGFAPVLTPVAREEDLLGALGAYSPDLVFSPTFTFPGTTEGRTIPDLLASKGVGWVGSKTPALRRALSKPDLKEAWRAAGISTPDWFVVERSPDGGMSGLGQLEKAAAFPYFVKPAREGNSRGIGPSSVARSPLALFGVASALCERYGAALVEAYLGENPRPREFTVALIGSTDRPLLGVVEIVNPRPEAAFVSQGDKDGHRTEVASLGDPELRGRLLEFALAAFKVAQVEDYARMDIILHGDHLYAIEINGQPMIPDRWFEACARDMGLGPVQYLQAIAVASLAKIERTGVAMVSFPGRVRSCIPRQFLDELAGGLGL